MKKSSTRTAQSGTSQTNDVKLKPLKPKVLTSPKIMNNSNTVGTTGKGTVKSATQTTLASSSSSSSPKKTLSKLPPSFQKQRMQHTATMMMKKFLDDRNSGDHRDSASEKSNDSNNKSESENGGDNSSERKSKSRSTTSLNVTFDSEASNKPKSREAGQLRMLHLRSAGQQKKPSADQSNESATVANESNNGENNDNNSSVDVDGGDGHVDGESSFNVVEEMKTPESAQQRDTSLDSLGRSLTDVKTPGSTKRGFESSMSRHSRPASPSFASPVQTIKIFGDTKSSVHSLRATLCIDTLKSGCINAFWEFFTLSHRKPVMIDPISETYFSIPHDKLVTIKELLVKADEFLRDSNYKAIYEIYRQIADYFEMERDIDTALYFHSLGQQLAKRSSDILLEGIAHENIGKVYERLGQTENALKSHEAHLSLADASKDTEEASKARRQLWEVYIKIATDHEAAKNYQSASTFYEKSLKIAKSSNNKEMIALSHHHLGRMYEQLDDYASSLENQEKYIQLCEDLDDQQGRASM